MISCFKVLTRLIALLFATTLYIVNMPKSVFALAQAKDIDGHWAASAIDMCQADGIMMGYDGYFRPDETVTRAEFAAMVNRAFGYDTLDVPALSGYIDIPSGSWYDRHMETAINLGIITGYCSETAAPNDNITREQAAVILCKVLRLKAPDGWESTFSDINYVSPWAADAVRAMEYFGYATGYNNEYSPGKSVTRGEAAQLLCNVFGTIVDESFDAEGQTFRNVTIRKPDVLLKNAEITGDLFITEGVGDGSVFLDSLSIGGKLLAAGGGENSIHINNVNVKGSIIVDKPLSAGKEPVSFRAVQTNQVTIIIEGTVSEVVVSGNTIVLSSKNGEKSIFNMFMPEAIELGGIKPGIIISDNAVIEKITSFVPMNIMGGGMVGEMEILGIGVEIAAEVKLSMSNVKAEKGIEVIIGGETVIGAGLDDSVSKLEPSPAYTSASEPYVEPENSPGKDYNDESNTSSVVIPGTTVKAEIVGSATPVAGMPATVRLVVQRSDSSVDTGFTGSYAVTVSGVNGTASDIALNRAHSVSFTNGVGTLELSIQKAATQNVRFRVTGVTHPNTNSILITPTPAELHMLSITQDAVLPLRDGTDIKELVMNPKITLLDMYGNIRTNDSLTMISINVQSGAITLSGETTVKAEKGIASFSGLGIMSADTVSGIVFRFASNGIYIDSSEMEYKNIQTYATTIDKSELDNAAGVYGKAFTGTAFYITNTGNDSISDLQIAISNTDNFALVGGGTYSLSPGEYTVVTIIPDNSLTPGIYSVALTAASQANPSANSSTGSMSFTVSKAVPTTSELSYNLSGVVYDGSSHSVLAAAKAGVDGLGNITIKYNDSETAPKNASIYAITADIGEGSNYEPAELSLGNFEISKAELIVTDASHTKQYDGSTSASGVEITLGGKITGDDVSADIVVAAYTSKNAGIETINISNIMLKGEASGNYYVALPINGIYVEGITKRQLTEPIFTVEDKDKDGGIAATVDVTGFLGKVDGDDVALTATGTFEDANPGLNKAVDIVFSVTGGDNSNYLAPEPIQTGSANIWGVATLSDLVYNLSQVLTYNAMPQWVSVEKSNANIGSITVYYEGVLSTVYEKSTTAPTNAGTYIVTADIAEKSYYKAVSGLVIGNCTISKAVGGEVGTPYAAEVTHNSITAGSLTVIGNTEQQVEYSISASANLALAGEWQTQLTFGSLQSNSSYYIFARPKESENYNAGTAVMSAVILTATETVNLTMSITNNQSAPLSPLNSDKVITLTVTVSGFTNQAEANGAVLTIDSVDGLTITGHSIGTISGNKKTFTITITLREGIAFEGGSAQINITGLSGIQNYLLNGTKDISVSITDGMADYNGTGVDRRIQVTRSNFSSFSNYARTVNGLAYNYKLVEDVELNGNSVNWTPIGIDSFEFFYGSFDGCGYTIKNLNISAEDNYQGMFGYINFGGTVKNLSLENVSIIGEGNYVGAIAGINCGTIQNCFVSGSVEGSNYVGAIVGRNGMTGSGVATVQDCYTVANVKGISYVGGVVGHNSSNSKDTMVKNCYATGDVIGTGNYVGGIAGNNANGLYTVATVQNCIALNRSVNGISSTGRVVGSNSGNLINVYGLVGMPTILDTNGDINGVDAELNTIKSKDFWESILKMDFAGTWYWQEGKMPSLKDISSAMDWPLHLESSGEYKRSIK